MLWLYLLGTATVLAIALRRVVRRQNPLHDEIYLTRVAIDRLQSGVAWVHPDGRLGMVNPSLAETLNASPQDLAGREWLEIFALDERERARESYTRMLLLGMTEFNAYGQRVDGTYAWLNVLLVACRDHRMRFVGHHCLILDSTRAHILQDRVKELEMDAISVR